MRCIFIAYIIIVQDVVWKGGSGKEWSKRLRACRKRRIASWPRCSSRQIDPDHRKRVPEFSLLFRDPFPCRSLGAGRPACPPQVPQGPTPTKRVGMWARCPITKRADRPRGALWPAGWGDFAWRRPFRAWVWAGPASRPRNFHPHRPPAAPRPANATLRWAKTARNSVKPAC